ncbi:cyclic nucleotide-binding domain-containing protein 2-like [Glandiceps talaboti]
MESVTLTARERFDFNLKREHMRTTLEKMGMTQPIRRRKSKTYRRASDIISQQGTPPDEANSRRLNRSVSRIQSELTFSKAGRAIANCLANSTGNASTVGTNSGVRDPEDGTMPVPLRRTGRPDEAWLKRKANHSAYLYQKFRMVGKLIGFMYRLCKKHFHVADSEDSSAVVMYGQEERVSNSDLLFDLSAFKAQKQGKVTQEAKRIMQLQSRERTEKELYHVQVALRNIESIACYPVHMHRKLAEVGWYQSFEPKRIILRQGYMPINYYFILSGSAVVSEFNVEQDKVQTVGILNKGESFGVKAILTCSHRESTVIALERVELLCIDIDDYTEIFMSGGLETLSRGENIEFLRSLYFLQTWPLDILADNPKKCTLSYFRKGQLLVKDSVNDKWIYIVKSGSCDLLKKVTKSKNGESHDDEKILQRGSRIDMMFESTQTKDDAQIFMEELKQAREMEKKNNMFPTIPEDSEDSETDYVTVKKRKHTNGNDDNRHIQEGAETDDGDDDDVISHRETESRGGLYQFIKLKTLTTGDTFGLADLAYGARNNFFLISDGAECVMISKKLFLDNASIDTLLTIKKTESELPTDDRLHHLLQTQNNWTQYRKDTIERKLMEKQKLR